MKTTLPIIVLNLGISFSISHAATFEEEFENPPLSARPGVYWYFMDGNLNRDEMTHDLESIKEAGLGNLVFLEVDVGVPRGPVKFMSEEWQNLFAHAVHEAERLAIDITLGSGPGWTGSGGPWVKPEHSMQHLVFSEVETKGPGKYDAVLPMPEQRSTEWHQMRNPFYEDVVVFAFPRCKSVISDINEKALFERDPYTSKPGVKPYLPVSAHYIEPDPKNVISLQDIVDLTQYLDADGRLKWDVPSGEWTIVRMGRRSTGASTRPAPLPGVGLECDKFDAAALDEHFINYYGKLLEKVGQRRGKHGWTTIHIDSWEMGAQNWTGNFIEEFRKRRGYDPKPYLSTYTGRAVGSLEMSERFLWDIRMTCQELVMENHAKHLKTLGDRHGFELSIEPYDMNPTADLDLGAVADVPMAEFWSSGYGFDSSFSCIEATSIAHTMGRPIVSAEAFTADGSEGWRQYPWSMKNQGDWAFCMGINRFVYHTFAHKPLGEEYRPGMTMGPYGVHWDRGQTWWPMVKDYHRYVTRCSHMLRQGIKVSDILFLTPEGAPHVFCPPPDAVDGQKPLEDKKGYGFDGCSPGILMARAVVQNGRIVFPGGSSYRLMVLPLCETMTPALVTKISELIKAGALVIGSPPVKSPSLSNYPECDKEVQLLANKLWGSFETPKEISKREYGKGCLYWGGEFSGSGKPNSTFYPSYKEIAALLKEMNVREDFISSGPVRYTHRSTGEQEIYFVSNKSDSSIKSNCTFRIVKGQPELWNPVNGERRLLPQYTIENDQTTIPMEFAPYESFFVVFSRNDSLKRMKNENKINFPKMTISATLEGSWDISFDPKWGGPKKVTFDILQDWIQIEERGVKYYSGIATYLKVFDFPQISGKRIYLDLGTVYDIARVTLNGKDLGVIWCAPWRVDITGVVKAEDNRLEIEVANRWTNRLIGDSQAPDVDFRTVKWPSGLLSGKEYKTGRYTFTTGEGYKKLLPSGLLGPVRIMVIEK
ncbi:MAG: glycosyl hydrolase [Candidatus Latescibacteria bacterium]|nr:glycosyl hydrolase [Candidatus Latescibacterota bacterium]